MRDLYALLRLMGTFNAIFKGLGAVGKRQARKVGTRATRKVVD
jgi:hypothetical protein